MILSQCLAVLTTLHHVDTAKIVNTDATGTNVTTALHPRTTIVSPRTAAVVLRAAVVADSWAVAAATANRLAATDAAVYHQHLPFPLPHKYHKISVRPQVMPLATHLANASKATSEEATTDVMVVPAVEAAAASAAAMKEGMTEGVIARGEVRTWDHMKVASAGEVGSSSPVQSKVSSRIAL